MRALHLESAILDKRVGTQTLSETLSNELFFNMEREELTSNELKNKESSIYDNTVMAIIKIIGQIGRTSYSMNGYWMSSEVFLELPSKIPVGPYLFHLSDREKSGQLSKIGRYRNGSGSKSELRLYFDYSHYIVMPMKMNTEEFPYRTTEDFLPTITILRCLEYLKSIVSPNHIQ